MAVPGAYGVTSTIDEGSSVASNGEKLSLTSGTGHVWAGDSQAGVGLKGEGNGEDIPGDAGSSPAPRFWRHDEESHQDGVQQS